MIRIATKNDISSICELSKLIENDYLDYQYIENKINDDNYLFLVSEEDKIIGFLFGFKSLNEFEIEDVAVLKEYRRRKVASSLIDYIEEYFKDIDIIYLEVREKNIAARNLYEKLNFKQYRYREGYYVDDNCICMCRKKANYER